MSGSITSQGSTTGSASTGATTGSTGTGSATDALSSLTGNFSTFLTLLMTQLQNQDPTSPMDTSQFTSELVQFTSVEQQINTNTNLGTLIGLQQGSEVVQATALVGKSVTATSSQLALQNSTATIGFTAPAAEPVGIVVSNGAGNQVYAGTVSASNGTNSWTWNGLSSAGQQMPDGLYTVTVTGDGSDGGATTLATTVTGNASGVTQNGSQVQLVLGGSLPVNFSSITNVGTTSVGTTTTTTAGSQ